MSATDSAAGQRDVILFDGVCHLCSGTVGFVLTRDRSRRFVFAPLQSEVGQTILGRAGLPLDENETLVLVEGDRYEIKSTAALRIARRLSGLWPLLYVLVIVPRPLRDFCYDVVARNRYYWFGRRDECYVPTSEERTCFLA